MRINFIKHINFVKPLCVQVALFFSSMKPLSLIVVIALLLLSCAEKDKKKTSEKMPAADSYTMTELDERLTGADSAVFVFYTDPFTKDSLQYTRYYKQYSTTATAAIQSLQEALNGTFTKEERPKPCRNEGKAWIFSKNKIFQTVYFGWSKNNCSFIYLIKDGFFYYTDIKNSFISTLKNYQEKAIEP